jgi:hypothetical protein
MSDEWTRSDTTLYQTKAAGAGIPYITPEGRIAVRIVPVEMEQPAGGP